MPEMYETNVLLDREGVLERSAAERAARRRRAGRCARSVERAARARRRRAGRGARLRRRSQSHRIDKQWSACAAARSSEARSRLGCNHVRITRTRGRRLDIRGQHVSLTERTPERAGPVRYGMIADRSTTRNTTRNRRKRLHHMEDRMGEWTPTPPRAPSGTRRGIREPPRAGVARARREGHGTSTHVAMC